MARARRPQDASLADLLSGPILVMDGIAKTDNVGAIIRNAAAFGITNILVDHRTCHPFQRRAVRTSMGNVYGMKIHQTRNLATDLQWLKSQGVQVIGFENRPTAVNLGELQFTSKTALIIGSEATGMSPEVMATVNQLVRIPIDEDVYALNAACASAVALYAFKEKLNPH
jgi:tRNA G18 (ribose-2'-O)-methylase SpoU